MSAVKLRVLCTQRTHGQISYHPPVGEHPHRPHYGHYQSTGDLSLRLSSSSISINAARRHVLRRAWRAWWFCLDAARSFACRRHFQNGNIKVYGFDELLFAIRSLPTGSLWRHNVAGDLTSNNRTTVDPVALKLITEANTGRRGFTFTHFDVLTNLANREAIRSANANGFTINLSANSLAHADQLADLGIAPVTVLLPSHVEANTTTPKGRPVVICPTYTTEGVTCATCGLCARQRSTIVGFPAIGGQKHKVT